MIRILPTSAVIYGGRAAWLSPVPALLGGLVLRGVYRWLRRTAPEGAGLADLTVLSLGKAAGRAMCVLYALWLTFYGGFVARSASERLLATVYPNGGVGVFIAVMLVVALITASGLTKTLSRTAEVLMPLLLAVIAAVLLSALPDVASENLLPVTYLDAGSILYGALPIFNVLSAFAYFLFLMGHVEPPKLTRGNSFPWMVLLVLVAFGATFFTLGTLGDKLAISMENAFFMVIRNIRVFGVVERVESVVVGVWIVTDFIFLGAVIMIVSELWRTVTGAKRRAAFVPPTAALCAAAAFFISPDAFDFQRWSDFIIPAINMTFTLVLIPLPLIAGKLRRKY